MDKFSLNFLKNKTVSLIGYGVSNRAIGEYLQKNGIGFLVRSRENVDLPSGIEGVFGEDYLKTTEDVVFRSPSVNPRYLKGNGRVFTEISFSLEGTHAYKIGVTGSDGKTTTSTMINEILKREHSSFLVGNIGTPLIKYADKIKNDDYLVCELSSFQLADYTPVLDIAVVTGISQNHLDWHTSMADYIFAKRNILKKARLVVVNYDSPYKDFFLGENTIYFSLHDISHLAKRGIDCVYIKDDIIYHNATSLFEKGIIKAKGKYNLLNALSAISATYDSVSLNSIREALSSFSGVSHRAQEIDKINGITFIDSSIDSTPARTKSTLSAFPKEKSIVIMGGYDKNLSYECLGEEVRDLKCVVLFGENREKIYQAIKSSVKIINVNNIFEATNASYKEASVGDFVILSPASASFDMFKNYKERAEKFKKAIRDLKNGEVETDFK
ncbi:MAG: UDP-N-acetylmuramoyl-L-alanine--D-glutamate ligase [Clostridia bacterium]|nr:UDP-N-acetylmuramoyl-L-alanine--D-glutamate ligase [Clostridia bacterium]